MTANNVTEPTVEVNTKKTKAPPSPPPAWALVEDENTYHAASKSGDVMSSGMLKRFRQCPYAYREYILGHVQEQDKAAYRFGRAVHKIVLEGIPAFNKAYAISNAINPKTGKSYGFGTKAHDEWMTANGLDRDHVITDEESNALIAMANAVKRHDEAKRLLSFGWPELVIRLDMGGVLCQIRMDWFTHNNFHDNAIIDLKTTEDMTWFESDARRYGYTNQLAFYRDVFQAQTGEPVMIKVIALEKKFPFRVGLWELPNEVLDAYSNENALILESLKICQLTGDWPTGYENPRVFSF
jgi:hypothetical protein